MAEPQPRPGDLPPDLPTLASRINWLVERVHPPGRGPYSNAEIAALIHRASGQSVSHNAIWKLRNGQNTNPTKRLIDGLAQAFGVPPAFFFGDTAPADQVELLALIRDSGITAAHIRALAELTPEGRQAIADLIAHTARAEQERQRSRQGKPHR